MDVLKHVSPEIAVSLENAHRPPEGEGLCPRRLRRLRAEQCARTERVEYGQDICDRYLATR